MADFTSSPPVRIEASTAGEERSARDGRALKPAKPVVASRNDPKPPDIELEKEEKHQLDERA
jgi:hypothetical protein